MIFPLLNLLHRYLLPNCCLICNKSLQIEGYFCEKCWPTLGFIGDAICKVCCQEFTVDISDLQNICAKCIANPPIYNESRSLMKFTPNSQKLIHQFKYYNSPWLAKVFAKLIIFRYECWIKSFDAIIAVPMHKLKRIWRGYNQAHVLAKELSHLSDKFILNDVLTKSRITKSQSSLTKKERLKNLNDSFDIGNIDFIKEKNILLVDDVITTGSTVNLCASLLKKNGANKVGVITIANT